MVKTHLRSVILSEAESRNAGTRRSRRTPQEFCLTMSPQGVPSMMSRANACTQQLGREYSGGPSTPRLSSVFGTNRGGAPLGMTDLIILAALEHCLCQEPA
jgi:hypothetical protein